MHPCKNNRGRSFRSDLDDCNLNQPVLEDELGANLNSARLVCARDLSEVLILHHRVHATEVGMVERVEVLTAQLEPEMLTDVRVLDRRQVPVLHARSDERMRTLRAKMPNGLCK